jgi:uncharacterized protein YkwD
MEVDRRVSSLVLALPLFLLFTYALSAHTQAAPSSGLQAQAEQLFALANQARAANGAGPLRWDPALAAAALAHCRLMAREGEIAHRYGGEADLTERAGQAGAHFSLIEENVALGSYVDQIHQGWMNSPGHRANLLNPEVNRVGIAVVRADGVFYAVADYAHAVEALTPAQVEASVGASLRAKGLMIELGTAEARAYCESDGRYRGANPPQFLMRWQNPDATQLPRELLDRMADGRYRKAEVASCSPRGVEGGFTVYRIGVLLY